MKRRFIRTMDLAPAIIKSVMEDYVNDKVIDEDQNWGGNIIEPPIDVEALKQLKTMSVTHRKCLKAVAVDTVLNGWVANNLTDNGKDTNKERIEYFMKDYDSLDALKKFKESERTFGYGVVEILQDNAGEVKGFKHIRSTTVRMCKGRKSVVQEINGKKVYFKIAGTTDEDINCENGNFGKVPPELRGASVLWINGDSDDSDVYGEPEYFASIPTIISDHLLREFNYNGLKNGRIPNYLIIISGNFSDEDEIDPETNEKYSPFERDMEEALSGVKNKPGSALVYTIPTSGVDGSNINVEVIKLTEEMTDASYEKMRQSNQDEILEAHEVPPQRLGINPTGALGGNLSLEINKQYNSKVIHPAQNQLENMLNKVVIKRMMQIDDFELIANGLDVDDSQVKYENALKAVDNGVMKPKELRENFAEMLHINPEEDDITNPELDKFYFNGIELGVKENSTSDQQSREMEILKAMDAQIKEMIYG